MNVEQILDVLRALLADRPVEVYEIPIGETVVVVPPDSVHPAVRALIDQFSLTHLSTITGHDTGQEIELLYHFWDGQGLTLRTQLPRDHAVIHTLIDLIPGAAFYEREVTEMLDVVFEWHPMTDRLILPDDWHGDPPLRKGDG